jgi:hypothetical protein
VERKRRAREREKEFINSLLISFLQEGEREKRGVDPAEGGKCVIGCAYTVCY